MRGISDNRFILGAAFLSVVALVGAACNPTNPTSPETNANNRNTTVTTTTPTPAATPTGDMSNMNGQMGGMGNINMQSSPGATQAPFDLQFIDTMISHHQSALDMSRPAVGKAQHAELKEFARKIISDQEREIAELKRYREQWYAGKPQAMNMEMPGMMDSMKGMDMNKMNAATGNAYDLMFIDMMTQHHAGAVTMARDALTRAEHPEIKRIAQQIITAQEREIVQMNGWKQLWSKQS